MSTMERYYRACALAAVVCCALALLAMAGEGNSDRTQDVEAEIRRMIADLEGQAARLRVAKRVAEARSMHLVMSEKYRKDDRIAFPEPERFREDISDIFGHRDIEDIVYYGPMDVGPDEGACRVLWHDCVEGEGVRVIVFADGHVEVAMRPTERD